ncbi:MAG TPA: AAA family ATPase, partial [Candidatus Dormibacteraeota bacterium]|nr:AAA family ATPase [Candidatus Dormibacteraeota bacterium]
MHLKSVEIQGFKTFARRTELLFEPGVTAVVGPNGSGKSNLVDAIRWVLGERSARELRGAKMEEVIYSGGARRPASGMAEVRLVIDNADGRLPVPYTEVEVVRRGYRSGESDYWLNGARCRLKDLELLFASTGLTQQGYAVVAQDDVDFIIQTSATERRAMLEEAAGVRGLRGQRQEAMAKLREADLSLLRLDDLVRELAPRVAELRSQAEQAGRHNELTARLQALRGSLLRGEWLAARQRVARLEARVQALTAQVAGAAQESESTARAYEAQRQRLAAAHDARLQRERRLGELRLAASQAVARVELVEERERVAVAALEASRQALADAETETARLAADLAATRLEAADAEGLTVDESDERAIAEHAAAVEAQTAAEAAHREAQARAGAAAGQRRGLEAQLEGLAQRREGLLAALAEAEAELGSAEAEAAGGVAATADRAGAAAALAGARAGLDRARAAEAEARAA